MSEEFVALYEMASYEPMPMRDYPADDPFCAVKFPGGGLAFRYDPVRGIVEIQRRGVKHLFDLAALRNADTEANPHPLT
jgi:hypothetical protein